MKIIINESILTEAPIDDIFTKYYEKDFSNENFLKIISYDPTTIIKEGVPVKMGMYSKWLLDRVKVEKIKLEDLYKIKGDLEIFNKNKNSLSKLGFSNDIIKYKTVRDLYELIKHLQDNVSDEDLLSNAEKERNIKKEAKKIYEDDTWIVVVPQTEEAACFYGKGTRWCTAATGSENYFDHYNEEGRLFININKNTKRKFQFHFESEQFMDEDDEMIYPPDYLTDGILNFYNNIPETLDIFAKHNIKNVGRNIWIIVWDDYIETAKYFKKKDLVKEVFGENSYEVFELSYQQFDKYMLYDVDKENEALIISKLKEKDLYDEELDLEENLNAENDDICQSIAMAHNNARESNYHNSAVKDIISELKSYFNLKDLKWRKLKNKDHKLIGIFNKIPTIFKFIIGDDFDNEDDKIQLNTYNWDADDVDRSFYNEILKDKLNEI